MAALSSRTRIEVFDTLGSTSAEARRRVAQGERGPLWFVARRQTAGYGRRGREWQSAAGDFAGTLVLTPEGNPSLHSQLSFVAALAVRAALSEFIDENRLTLKWPNDVLADDAKIAGLLLERFEGPGEPVIGLGIGINIVSAPKGMPYPTARLRDLMQQSVSAPGIEQVVEAIDQSWDHHYGMWRDKGFATIREHWLNHAKGVGAPIGVRLPQETVAGIFEGLDPNGALVLRQGNEKRIISAGDVFFGEGH